MKRAIYPGSFDPITNGHVDVVKRAQRLFDEVIISVIQNPEKKSLFTIEERKSFIRETFDSDESIKVDGFEGLLVDYAKQKGVHTIVRGLRAVSDFDFEFQMALTNRQLDSEIETVFLMTASEYSYLSSSVVKQLALYDADISLFVPECVKKALREKKV